MSIRIMTQVWESGPEDRGQLLVLLALADFANDEGECWPSVATVAQKVRMTSRSVQRTVQKLVASGWLSVDTNAARKGCNLYKIALMPRNAKFTPDYAYPLTSASSPLPPAPPFPDERVTPPTTPASPEPSRTVIEPSASAGTPDASSADNKKQTAREKLLAAIGIGTTGIAGPSHFLGTSVDMAEADRWTEMGISLEVQCRVIAEVCHREQAKDPSWMPKRFRYFTGAMRDSLQQRSNQSAQSESKTDRIKFYRGLAAS